MQDFNTKATQTDNHNNTLTSVSTQTDNHSRSGELEVNTGFSNNPEILESRSKTTAIEPQELEGEDPVLAIASHAKSHPIPSPIPCHEDPVLAIASEASHAKLPSFSSSYSFSQLSRSYSSLLSRLSSLLPDSVSACFYFFLSTNSCVLAL